MMAEKEVLRVGGVEGERMNVSGSQRRPTGGPVDGRLATAVQDATARAMTATAATAAPPTRTRARPMSSGTPAAIWRGLPTEDHVHADENDVHERDDVPICRSRDEVRSVFEGMLAQGRTGHPLILAGAGDSVVVDPQPEPMPFPLHHGFTFRGGRVVLIQDYPDRDSALADLGAQFGNGHVG